MSERRTGRVAVIGSANVDLVAQALRLPAVGETVAGHGYFEAAGGKGLNQAVAAARAGAETVMVACIGSDHAGAMLRSVMQSDAIDTTAVRDSRAPTGRALIGVQDDGANSIIVVPGANAELGARDIVTHAPLIASADVVLAQLETPIAATAEAFGIAKAIGAMTVLNPAPAQHIEDEVLALVDVLVPNEHETALLGGVERLCKLVPHLIVTLGDQGADWYHAGTVQRIPPFEVQAIDTVAAGDAFCGALSASLAAGETMQGALRTASAAGALATTRVGAVPSIPTSDEITALISEQG